MIDTSKKNLSEAKRSVNALPLFESLRALRQSLSLEIRDVSFVYATRPDHPVLKGISLNVTPGSITAVCGR